jgi:hypothetical protein
VLKLSSSPIGEDGSMAVADDPDRATDSKWDWVAGQTQTYLASGDDFVVALPPATGLTNSSRKG